MLCTILKNISKVRHNRIPTPRLDESLHTSTPLLSVLVLVATLGLLLLALLLAMSFPVVVPAALSLFPGLAFLLLVLFLEFSDVIFNLFQASTCGELPDFL